MFSRVPVSQMAYIHEIKDYIIPTLILMAKISNRTANPFIWMANSIGEIVEKQKNEKVTLLFGTGSSIGLKYDTVLRSDLAGFCKIKNLTKSC